MRLKRNEGRVGVRQENTGEGKHSFFSGGRFHMFISRDRGNVEILRATCCIIACKFVSSWKKKIFNSLERNKQTAGHSPGCASAKR